MKRLFLLLAVTLILNCCALRTFAADGWASMNGGTTGGYGGTVVTVTTASLFKSYVESTSTYIVEVSGTINLSSVGGKVNIRSNKTIRGVGTSPTIVGNLTFRDDNINVIIERLNITNPYPGDQYDGISIRDRIKNVLITHCTFYDCGDGCLDISEQSDFITVSWCKFYYNDPAPAEDHRFVNLIGSDDGATGDRGKLKVTFHHNWWAQRCRERMPRVRFGQVHIYNNYYGRADTLSFGNNYCIRPGIESQLLVQNNYFYRVNKPIDSKETGALVQASGNYMFHCDNEIPGIGEDTVFTPPYFYILEYGPVMKNIVIAGAGADGIEPAIPAIPTALTATANETSVLLDWDDNTEPDLRGYYVYRSTTSGSGYTKNTPSPISNSVYTDNSVVYGTPYYYVITSVSTLYRESEYSTEVLAIPRIYGDFEVNHVVDINDLGYLSDLWLINDCQAAELVDFNDDCTVNFIEFVAMAENWLTQ